MRHLRPLHHLAGPVLACAALSGLAQAQIAINEIHHSMAGQDDDEFVELIAAPGTSLDGVLFMVVEGDSFGQGTLDKVFDLTGLAFGASDSYFVLGNPSTFVNPDYVLSGINSFENSSQTFYLVSVPDANLRTTITATWIMTDIRTTPGSGSTTMITTTPGITVLDKVAMMDADVGDVALDNALAMGPDGSFYPSGIFRPGDCPNDWCTDEFTNFNWDPDGSSNGGVPVVGAPNDPTPGAQNFLSNTCTRASSGGSCSGSGSVGTNYCNANPNSTGVTGTTRASGSTVVAQNNVTLAAQSLPNNAFAFFLVSRDAGFIANPGGSQGNLCLAGSIGRYVGPGQIQNSGGAGGIQLAINLNAIPQPLGATPVAAGETWRFTCWHRDVVGGVPTSNFTDGLAVMFN